MSKPVLLSLGAMAIVGAGVIGLRPWAPTAPTFHGGLREGPSPAAPDQEDGGGREALGSPIGSVARAYLNQ